MSLANEYAAFFEKINKDTSISQYAQFFDKNSSFKDPFHEVKGIKEIYQIFQKMYENLEKPYFKVNEIVENRNIAYIKWQFFFSFKNSDTIDSFEGVSRVIFNEHSKIVFHEDFWDASENIYEKLPLIKYIIKFVKHKIKN